MLIAVVAGNGSIPWQLGVGWGFTTPVAMLCAVGEQGRRDLVRGDWAERLFGWRAARNRLVG